MWLLQFFPGWLFSLLFFIGIIGYLAAKTFKLIPGLNWISIAVVFFAVYMSGIKTADDSWRLKAAELEKKVVELEAKSAKTNTEIVTKVITKQQVIKEKGEEVIKYIDREIVKYDNTCKLPKELLEAHNKAAAK